MSYGIPEYVENFMIFATGLLFGYHIFGKNGGWWVKKKEKKEKLSDDEYSDSEVNFFKFQIHLKIKKKLFKIKF